MSKFILLIDSQVKIVLILFPRNILIDIFRMPHRSIIKRRSPKLDDYLVDIGKTSGAVTLSD